MKTIVDPLHTLGKPRVRENSLENKALILKQGVISHIINQERVTISEVAQHLNMSVPKISEIINELLKQEILYDHGKAKSNIAGRKPNNYGLNPNFMSSLVVDIRRDRINMAVLNFKNEIVEEKKINNFDLENTMKSYDSLCHHIQEFISEIEKKGQTISGIALSLTGRINHKTGNSYSYYDFLPESLKNVLEKKFCVKVYIENDTRAMAYGEYMEGIAKNEKNVLYIFLDNGIGMGIIANGELYSGKSGFAGEFGHMPFLNNDLICHCGKKGCLETEASGYALIQKTIEAIESGVSTILTKKVSNLQNLKLKNIVDAARNDDILAIDILSKAGEKIGKGIAILLNLFNPDVVVLSGTTSQAESVILLPILSSINRFSLNLVNTDTEIKLSTLGEDSAIIGSGLLLRNKLLGLS